jgi:hypothetical protein
VLLVGKCGRKDKRGDTPFLGPRSKTVSDLFSLRATVENARNVVIDLVVGFDKLLCLEWLIDETSGLPLFEGVVILKLNVSDT